jgi:ribosomal protein L12E/L44/L45/RPP1/RPP2
VQVGQAVVSSYSIQGAASIQLVQSASHLSVGGVKPQDGYVFSAENVTPTRVIVTLTNSSHRLKFNAEVISGRVVTSLISSDVVAAAPVAAAPTNTTPRRTKTDSKKDSRSKKESRNKNESRDQDDDDDDRDEREDEDDD